MQNYKEPNIEHSAHVNDEGRPLCNQGGDCLQLFEPDEFEKLPKEFRCQRCEQFLSHCLNLSNNKQQLLTEISRRTPDRDSWCPVTDLCKSKTKAELTSLSRTLRQLELEGLVEMRTDNHNQSFVRLCDKGNSTNPYLLDVFQMRE
jgi:DNA-binding MarR family transcriptional regulator